MQLGVLDVCWTRQAADPRAALEQTVSLARHAERLGYGRYWVTEHHSPEVWQASPETLVPILAAATKTIRIGTAGVLLKLKNPLCVAKAFALLETAYPGRVDLGVAAGRASPPIERAFIGNEPLTEERFREKVGGLVAFIRDERYGARLPDVGIAAPWLLGSGGPTSAQLAAEHGTSFSLGLFFAGGRFEPDSLARYRDEFRPSAFLREPQWNVAVAGVCAETEREARRIAASYWADTHVLRVVGDPTQCAEQLREIAERFDTKEIVFMDACERFDARLRSLSFLAEAVGG